MQSFKNFNYSRKMYATGYTFYRVTKILLRKINFTPRRNVFFLHRHYYFIYIYPKLFIESNQWAKGLHSKG